MEFSRIEDAVGKWVIVRFANWPEDLKGPVTGLGDVEGRWLQFKLQGVDNFGIWLENPYFKVSPSSGSESKEIPQERKEALKGKALVLVKWQYVGTIIYLEGQKVDEDHIPLGFPISPDNLRRRAG